MSLVHFHVRSGTTVHTYLLYTVYNYTYMYYTSQTLISHQILFAQCVRSFAIIRPLRLPYLGLSVLQYILYIQLSVIVFARSPTVSVRKYMHHESAQGNVSVKQGCQRYLWARLCSSGSLIIGFVRRVVNFKREIDDTQFYTLL